MAIPNLIALLLLSGVIVRETKLYMEYVSRHSRIKHS